MRLWTTLIVAAIFAVSAIAQDKEPDKDADKVRLVTTGEIRKIDSKNKTFQFKITMDPPARSAQVYRPQGGRGGGGGGRGRRGGIGFPTGGTGGRPNAQQQEKPVTLEIKVFTSGNTALKDTGNTINFTTLKVGQHVAVTGIHTTKGKPNDVEALEVDRTLN